MLLEMSHSYYSCPVFQIFLFCRIENSLPRCCTQLGDVCAWPAGCLQGTLECLWMGYRPRVRRQAYPSPWALPYPVPSLLTIRSAWGRVCVAFSSCIGWGVEEKPLLIIHCMSVTHFSKHFYDSTLQTVLTLQCGH